MPKLNSSYMSDLQTQTLSEKIESVNNTVDLKYDGYDRFSDESFERYQVKSHINRVLLWLASKPDDYVRESFKGGVLYSLIATRMDSANLSDWETEIKDRFNEEFASDLQMIYLKLVPNKSTRTLTLNIIVRDVLNRNNYSISTEVDY